MTVNDIIEEGGGEGVKRKVTSSFERTHARVCVCVPACSMKKKNNTSSLPFSIADSLTTNQRDRLESQRFKVASFSRHIVLLDFPHKALW